jgi:hypothetical protein
MKVALLVLFLLLAMNILEAQSNESVKHKTADTIFINGDILSGVVWRFPNPGSSRVQALAVRGDRIVAVGSNADVEKLTS